MQLKNNKESYGIAAKTFHWVIAALILLMLALGLYMNSLPMGPDRIKLIGWHKSTGALILGLAALRLGWLFYSPAPLLVSMAPMFHWAARITHGLLYLCMFLMPFTGWAMSSAAGFPVSVYGLFTLPDVAPKDNDLRKTLAEAHTLIAYVLMALIAAHVGAALWHHFVKKDSTLRRMLPAALLLSNVMVFGVYAADTKEIKSAPAYHVIADKSLLSFVATQNDAPVEGKFTRYTADIHFDPDNLEGSSITVEVDLSSASTTYPEVAGQLQGTPWFDALHYPKAVYHSTALHKMPGIAGGKAQGYYADGTLTLRGVTIPVPLNFTMEEFDDKQAVATGTVPLLRTAFGVGQGEWKKTDTVKDNVTVKFRIVAVPVK